MVLRLVRDVMPHAINVRRAHAERAVSLLPGEQRLRFAQPAAGIAFQCPHCVQQLHVNRQHEEDVDVVIRAAHGENVNSVIARNRGEIIPEPRLQIGTDELRAFLRAEHKVKHGADVRVGHDESVASDDGLAS